MQPSRLILIEFNELCPSLLDRFMERDWLPNFRRFHNSSEVYTTDAGETIHLAGARDVAEFAANSEQAQNGFIEQLFHHVVKQPMLAYGADIPQRLRRSFVASGFNIQQLLVEIAATSALYRVDKP